MKTVLFADAGSPSEYPTDGLPEVAVLGRSNVGKSSFINALIGRKRLARTSRTPGKTRRIHFYRLEDAMYLVDLPGFGYAAVGKQERARWRPMVESYLLASRVPLAGALLLVDARRGPREEERELLAWLRAEDIPTRVVLTKRDKLRPGQVARAAADTCKELELAAEHAVAISSTQKTALGTVAGWIRAWTEFALQRPDGGALEERGG
jgi:GTP-binding protein